MSKAKLDWAKTKAHFDRMRQVYQDLEGTPGVNTTFALRMIFDPLANRYNNGDRTTDLYEQMQAVE